MNLPIKKVILGSRRSQLARWQTDYIADLLREAWPGLECEVTYFVTQGDKTLDKPLPAIGGKGLFTLELEESLRAEEIDLAVHSLKDLPIEDASGLTLGAIVGRADVRDVLVTANGKGVADLPAGAVVGTSSRRRGAQMLRQRPDVEIRSIRGNVETRMSKVMKGEYDATLLAAAGVDRLGITEGVSERLSLAEMLPAPGQGALGVQCRRDDVAINTLLAAIDCPDVRAAVTAERAFLHGLGGGCSAPVAAYAEVAEGGDIGLQAWVGATDGSEAVLVEGVGDEPWSLGKRLAQKALGRGAGKYMEVSEGGERPLNGQRVVVTRPLAGMTSLNQALAQIGAEPVALPLIETRLVADLTVVDEALGELARYDWLIFTSANGVRYFGERVEALGLESWRGAGFKVAAVGPATATALGGLGLAAAAMPETFVGEAIAGVLGEVAGKRILLPRAAVAGSALVEALTVAGAEVVDLALYETVAVAPSVDRVEEMVAEGVAVWTFMSSSAVYSLVTLAGDRLKEWVGDSKVVCIGPVTAGTAAEAGMVVAAVAEPHTVDGLVAAVRDVLLK
ncbi:MAG TPA: hydroxymethylbilane synthase [Anaerolineae bacterium]|nr:hydroxymethylbilane synthase [Anaerolineae bacterium]